MIRLRQALATGLVLGACWGAAEALYVLLGPWLALWAELGVRPPLDLGEVAAVLLFGACRYAAVSMVVALVLTLALGPLLDRARGRPDPYLPPRLLLAFVIFANLYWWTKPLWAFSWGLPYYHWKRLLLAAAWIAVSLGTARLVVRRGGLLGPPPRWLVMVAAGVLALGGSWAWLREQELTGYDDVAVDRAAPNVLLVVVDALRADRLGVYGHVREPPTSPNVDALAEDGVVFDRAWVQAPFTWTSFGSMLTGKYPRRHGLIKMSPDQRLDPARNRTIAQALQEEGYATGAFLTGTLSNNTGLLQGFDTYFETIVGHEPVNRHSKWSVVRSRMLLSILQNKTRQALDVRLVNTEALRWIEDHADRPFFALVHYYSTHTPYDPPAPYDTLYDPDYDGPFHPFFQSHAVTLMKHEWGEGVCPADGKPTWTCEHFDPERDVEHIKALYDGGVRFADEMFGSLVDLLEELDIADETLVIFTSDHGEELYDHRIFEHDWMFNTNLDIPLVMRLPGGEHAGTRVSWPVEEIDIPSTILDVTGVGSLPDVDGRSLLPDIAGTDPGEDERHVFAENVRYVSMMNDRYKLTVNRYDRSGRLYTTRVFDLLADPGEMTPLDPDDAGSDAVIRALLQRLAEYERSMPSIETIRSFASDPEMAKQLAQLGYVGFTQDPKAMEGVEGELEDILSDQLMLGSNEILEEHLYERREP